MNKIIFAWLAISGFLALITGIIGSPKDSKHHVATWMLLPVWLPIMCIIVLFVPEKGIGKRLLKEAVHLLFPFYE